MLRSYREVLAVRGARALIGASAASQVGNWLYNAALLGYVYEATHSAGWVGAATVCRGLVKVLLGPFGGAVADRYPRRTVLLAGDLVRMVLMAGIAATVATGGPVVLVNGRLAASSRVSGFVIVAGSLACATSLAYAGSRVLAAALAVTVIGNAGLVSCQVVAQTALARIVPREALGRVIGILGATSAAAIVAGAVLAPVLVTSASIRASLLILGAAALAVTLACGLGLRGLDAVSAQQAGALASRVKVLEGLPVTTGVPQIVLEQLAAASRFSRLPPGVDVVVQGAPAYSFYAIVDGRVLVHRDGTPVVQLGPGDSFGERGLLDNAPRNATVTTETDTTLLRVQGHVLLDAIEAAPYLRPALDRSSTAPGIQVPPDETVPNETGSDETRPDETRPDEISPDETSPDETRPDETRPDDAGPDETPVVDDPRWAASITDSLRAPRR